MAESTPQNELERLLSVARHAEPSALSAMAARRMVRHASLQKTHKNRHWMFALAAAAALVIAFGTLLMRRDQTHVAVAANDEPLRLTLGTGDILLAMPASALSVRDDHPEHRQVALQTGSALFSVAKLGKTHSFEVLAGDVRVRVLGTVFSVSHSRDAGVVVHVYEGRVTVAGQVLVAPATWAQDRMWVARPEARLADEAARLVAARQATPAPVGSHAGATAPAQPVQNAGTGMPAQLPAESSAELPTDSTAASAQLPASSAKPHHADLADSNMGPAAAQHELAPPAEAVPAEAVPGYPSPAPHTWHHLAEAQLSAGDANAALAAALPHAGSDESAALLSAKALEVLGRGCEAAEHYTWLAELAHTRDPNGTHGGANLSADSLAFSAAQLRFHACGDARVARLLLARFRLFAPSSKLRERATALLVDVLLSEGRRQEASGWADVYLHREPHTSTSARMQRIANTAH